MLAAKAARPVPVVAIACFQFAKALVLASIAVVACLQPSALPSDNLLFLSVFYIAAHGGSASGLSPQILTAYAAAIAMYWMVMGWGIWNLKQWARRAVMISSGMTLALWARYVLYDSLSNWSDLRDPRAMQPILVLLFLDLIVFLNLFLGYDVKRAFKALDE